MSTALHRYGVHMRRDGVLLIAIGGSLGALVRYLVSEAVPATTFPWSTFAVNVVGSALLAVSISPTRPKSHRRIIGTGFCGGLTTFSSFTVEVASLTNDGRSTIAIVYLIASFVVGFAAFDSVRRFLQPGPPTPPTAP